MAMKTWLDTPFDINVLNSLSLSNIQRHGLPIKFIFITVTYLVKYKN
jgi:hypothetical protein